jgi:hypothetical protein
MPFGEKIAFIAGAITIIVLAALALLVFTTPGKRILNGIYPTAGRTIEFAKKASESVGAHHQKFERRVVFSPAFTQVSRFEGVVGRDRTSFTGTGAMVGFGSLALPPEAKFTVIGLRDQTFVTDPYDGTFHLVEDSRSTFDAALAARGVYHEYLEKLAASPWTFAFTRSGDVLSFSDPKIGTLYFDRSTYRLKEVRSSSAEKGELTYSFSFEPADAQFTPPQPNVYGDYWARESVVLSVAPQKAHDYLWTRWQQRNFGCESCVDPWADPDQDRLANILEFVFGSDPHLTSTAKERRNDREMIEVNLNPSTGQPIPAPFTNAKALLALPGPSAVRELPVRDFLLKK